MSICHVCEQEFKPKRKEQRICSIQCRQKNNGSGRRGQSTGPQSKQYKQRLTKEGYLRIYAAKHPYANGRKEIHVHVMIMELNIGRQLHAWECVHHLNGIKTDNRLENLLLMKHSDHSMMHSKEKTKGRKRDAGGRYA